jgi:calcineurin-like phosphoesterase family protein
VSRNIWVVSDTHFNHANILNFTNHNTGELVRPEFANVDEMNEVMIQNWNKVVKQGDKVYHLGDVFFGDREYFKSMWPRLTGSKRLIVGNHDDVLFLSSGGFFKKVQMWRIFSEFNIIMSHVPLHESGLYRNKNRDTPMLNVHGHIHQHKSPKGPYHCVCVEQTNYAPVHIEDLAKIANKL